MRMEIHDILVKENKTLKEAMKTIDKYGLRIAFVVDSHTNQFLGTITDGDIRRAILKGANLQDQTRKYMNPDPLTVRQDWNENNIQSLLQSKQYKKRIPEHGMLCIPVLDEKERVADVIFASEDTFESDLHPRIELKNNIKKVKPVNKVLVVGGAGFLGSVLSKKLLERGYAVRVLDNLTYGIHGLRYISNHPKFEFIKGDVRDIQTVVEAVKGVDAVIHLAAIVGDPASALDPEETIEIDYMATRMLADICRYSQINRFLFASTCSVYGASVNPETQIDEESTLNPVSLYAEMKLRSEQGILELMDENFSPTILRMATLHGLSPRMRFDLVVNTLSIKALKEQCFTIFGGNQWRPNLHVKDAAEAYICCLEAPLNEIRGEIFNIGSNDENYRIIELGERINQLIPTAKMDVNKKKVDPRNYNVLFDKIKTIGFHPQYTIDDGIQEIIDSSKQGEFDDYTHPKYSNYEFLQRVTSGEHPLLIEM